MKRTKSHGQCTNCCCQWNPVCIRTPTWFVVSRIASVYEHQLVFVLVQHAYRQRLVNDDDVYTHLEEFPREKL